MTRRSLITASLLMLAASGAWAQSLSGLWDATVTVNKVDIPFRMGFRTDGGKAQGWFFNGDVREISSGGKFANGSLELNFASYAAVLSATLKDGGLEGEYATATRKLPFRAVPAVKHAEPVSVPQVGGEWLIEDVKSSKGEKAWRLILKQSGAELSGAVMRVDGDTGTLTGRFQGDKFVLSHFSGARPLLLYVTPRQDGTLGLNFASQRDAANTLIAYRDTDARAKGLAEPADQDTHTGVKDPTKPFAFSFPDLNGNIVSNTDARFQGKVVLINITGSWCPNCHDEAPFLAEVYNKYHSQGLEIVGLSFEEADQLKDPERLRAFIAEYGIKYTVLLAGETDTAKEKLSQAANWDAWPTTFFVGRDGLVKYVHAGFAGNGTGELAKHEKQEFTERVEKLLAENQTARK